jgi:hypothetical protein
VKIDHDNYDDYDIADLACEFCQSREDTTTIDCDESPLGQPIDPLIPLIVTTDALMSIAAGHPCPHGSDGKAR